MPALSPYFARKALERLGLTDTNRRYALGLLDLAEPDHRIQVARIHAELFPLVGTASANTALQRLLKAVNEAAEQAGSPLRAAITSGKKLGPTQRWVWFEGPQPDPAPAETGELNAIPPGQLVADQRGMPAEDWPVVVLLTFNEHETAAVLTRFHPQGNPPVQTRNGMTYSLLGTLSGMRLVHRVSKQGEGEAQNAAHDAIRDWNPNAVIALGIAFGVNPAKQAIGDVLVSQCIRGYELGRVNADGTFDLRSDKPSASPVLYNRLDTLNQRRESDLATRDTWPKVRFGTLLSGNRLVDNLDYRTSLLALEKEVIGGEMEAVGIQLAADRHKVDWIIVKAICDWGDGHKGTRHKDQHQRQAADNAALVVQAALALGPLYDRPRPPADGDAPGPKRRRAPCREPDAEAMGVRDLALIPTRQRIEDARGLPASLHKDLHRTERPAPDTQGVPVMETLLDWVDQPEAPPYFALLGEYGMGKTVSCQRLAVTLRDRRREDPTRPLGLYFDLRNLTGLKDRVPRLKDVVEECMARGWLTGGGEGLDFPAFEGWLDQGVVVIFDGLDEALVKLSEPDGQAFTRELLRLVPLTRQRQRDAGLIRPGAQDAAGPRLRVLVSCRTQYFRTLRDQQNHFTGQERGDRGPDAFRALVLLPLDQDQVRRYLAGALPGTATDALLETIASVHNLTELTQRPYTLKLVSEFIPEIEADRLAGRPVYGVTLYRRMVERWLERDSGKHHIRPEHKLRLAAHLAAHLWREGSGLLPADAIEPWFHAWRESEPDLRLRYANLHPDQLEEDLRTATFLTRQDETDDKGTRSSFRFAHTSLLEYFLADYLLQALRDQAPERWAMKRPSLESLDFLGQRLAEAGGTDLARRLSGWRTTYRPQSSELLLDYGLLAYERNWPGSDLRGIALPGVDLTEREFRSLPGKPRLDLSGADLSGAKLRRAMFAGVRLRGTRLIGAQLTQASFLDCLAQDSDWSEAECSGAVWRGTNLKAASWTASKGHRPRFLLCEDPPAASAESPPLFHLARTVTQARPDILAFNHRLALVGGHDRGVHACAWCPDGKRIVSGGSDGTLRLWDAVSGESVSVMRGHRCWVNSCAWSPGGARVLSASFDGTLRVWDSMSGETLAVLKGHQLSVNTCSWSPDGARLLSGGSDGTLRVWDPNSGKALMVIDGQGGQVSTCAWSPDGVGLMSGGDDGVLRIWNAFSGKLLAAIPAHPGRLSTCAWSPDGARLVSGGEDGTLRVWDAASAGRLVVIEGQPGAVEFCAWSPDGTQLASGGLDGKLCLWDATSGEAVAVIAGHWGFVFCCAWSPDGTRLAFGGGGGTLGLSDAATGETLVVLQGHLDELIACAWSPDGSQFVSVDEDGNLSLWDAPSGEAQALIADNKRQAVSCAWSTDGGRLVSSIEDGTLFLWDTSTLEALSVIDLQEYWMSACQWSPDGALVLSGGHDGTLTVWDATSGQSVAVFVGHEDQINACAWSSDGLRVMSGSDDGTLRLWDSSSGEILAIIELDHGRVLSCAFSPIEERALSGSSDGTLHLWDAISWKPIAIIDGHVGPVTSCVFSPDGASFASTGADGTIRLWDAVLGEPLALLEGHCGRVNACAFSPDGSRVLSVGSDGTLRLWDALTTACLRIHTIHSRPHPGHAVWEPGGEAGDRLIEAGGEAWRWLHWRVPGQTDPDHGTPLYLPLDHFGPPPEPRRLGRG